MQLLILLCLLLPLQVVADSSVWKVSKGGATLFLGGTIHVLSAQDYPLPVEFDLAYERAGVVVLETDLNAMSQVDVQMRMMQRLMYPPDKSLRHDLHPATWQALADYVATTSLQLSVLEGMRPPLVMMTLTMAELQRLGMDDSGVDQYFNQRAQIEGKSLLALESVDLQIAIIEKMGQGSEDELILSTIAELKDLAALMDEMKAAWWEGRLLQLENIAVRPMQSEYPALYQSLLVDRNHSWLPKIETMLQTPEVEFVLVGALHLVGDDGIIEQLRLRGYQVEQVTSAAP